MQNQQLSKQVSIGSICVPCVVMVVVVLLLLLVMMVVVVLVVVVMMVVLLLVTMWLLTLLPPLGAGYSGREPIRLSLARSGAHLLIQLVSLILGAGLRASENICVRERWLERESE